MDFLLLRDEPFLTDRVYSVILFIYITYMMGIPFLNVLPLLSDQVP